MSISTEERFLLLEKELRLQNNHITLLESNIENQSKQIKLLDSQLKALKLLLTQETIRSQSMDNKLRERIEVLEEDNSGIGGVPIPLNNQTVDMNDSVFILSKTIQGHSDYYIPIFKVS